MRIRATAALIRSACLSVGLVVAAVFVGRVDLALLAIPFAVHLVWALLSPPGIRDVSNPVTLPKSVRMREGDSLALTVGIPTIGYQGETTSDADSEEPDPPAPFPGWMLSAAFPRIRELRTRPILGALSDLAEGEGTTVVVEPDRWGRYTIGPATVALTDPSGSWRADGTSTLVTVAVQPSAQILQASSGVAHPIGVTGAHTSTDRGDGSALADVREFRPGDRLTRINWRVTSRTGTLHVNSTLTDRDTDILIVADTTLDVPPDPGCPDHATSLDLTVRAIAAVIQQYSGFGDRIALHDLDNRIGDLPSGTGPRQMRLATNLLSTADRGPRRPTRIRPVTRVRAGTLVFFCSPLLSEQPLGELIRLHRMGAEVIAVDTLPQSVGSLSGPSTTSQESALPEAWAMRRLERDSTLRGLEARGIPVTPWRGPGSLAAVLLALEHARSAPRAGGGTARSGGPR